MKRELYVLLEVIVSQMAELKSFTMASGVLCVKASGILTMQWSFADNEDSKVCKR